jgi:hypothetical protein
VDGHGPIERDSGVLAAFGGGLDLKLTRSLGLRVAQFDLLSGRLTRDLESVDPVGGFILSSVSRIASDNWRFNYGLVINIWK